MSEPFDQQLARLRKLADGQEPHGCNLAPDDASALAELLRRWDAIFDESPRGACACAGCPHPRYNCACKCPWCRSMTDEERWAEQERLTPPAPPLSPSRLPQ